MHISCLRSGHNYVRVEWERFGGRNLANSLAGTVSKFPMRFCCFMDNDYLLQGKPFTPYAFQWGFMFVCAVYNMARSYVT